MGRSTNVPLEQRIPVWIELVPYLLHDLGIRYVSVVSHSAGTMFLLNTLHECRHVLHPDRPFVALLGLSCHIASMGLRQGENERAHGHH